MKKVILSVVAGVAITAVAGFGYVGYIASQPWQKIYSTNTSKTYINIDSVVVADAEQNVLAVWQKAVWPDGDYIMHQVAVHCETNQYYNKSAVKYNKDGRSLEQYPDETEWKSGGPGTNIQLTIDRVCNK